MINNLFYILLLLIPFTIIATDFVNWKHSAKKVRVNHNHLNSSKRISIQAENARNASGQPIRKIKI